MDALCHWKLDSCSELHKFVAGALKENDEKAINALVGGAHVSCTRTLATVLTWRMWWLLTQQRGDSIGTDDHGTSYWYFDDECWVYAEDKPTWQIAER